MQRQKWFESRPQIIHSGFYWRGQRCSVHPAFDYSVLSFMRSGCQNGLNLDRVGLILIEDDFWMTNQMHSVKRRCQPLSSDFFTTCKLIRQVDRGKNDGFYFCSFRFSSAGWNLWMDWVSATFMRWKFPTAKCEVIVRVFRETQNCHYSCDAGCPFGIELFTRAPQC